MTYPSISVGFPVYNEEATIENVMREADAILSGLPLRYELLILDDGSTDRSGAIIEETARQLSCARVIRHADNRGIRAAFERLYHEAANEWVFLNAADRQWDTRILVDMLPLSREADIIVASRIKKPYTPTRAFISWLFNRIPALLFGVRTYDAGAVKLMRREIIGRCPIISRSPFSEAERLIRASRAGYRILNYPVTVSPRRTGRSRGVTIRVLAAALRDVIAVWRDLGRSSAA